MNKLSYIERLKGHFMTITKHKILVMKHCFKAGLYRQGLLHDMSKYSPAEFFAGVKYYQGYRSPNNAQREAEGCSPAWLHHKGRNKHHFEYWIDYPGNGDDSVILKGMPMPKCYVVEMFCDRVAASKIYRGEEYKESDPLEYFLKGRGHYVIHEDAEKLLYRLLVMLAKHGEEYTFSYIRKKVFSKKI